MNVQYIIVIGIVLLAFAYVGNIFWQKVRSSTKKSACGSDCGCNEGSKKLPS